MLCYDRRVGVVVLIVHPRDKIRHAWERRAGGREWVGEGGW